MSESWGIGQPNLLDVAFRAGEQRSGVKHDRTDKAPDDQADANVRQQLPDRHVEQLRIHRSERENGDGHVRRRPERSQCRASIPVENVVPPKPDPERSKPNGGRQVSDHEAELAL